MMASKLCINSIIKKHISKETLSKLNIHDDNNTVKINIPSSSCKEYQEFISVLKTKKQGWLEELCLAKKKEKTSKKNLILDKEKDY